MMKHIKTIACLFVLAWLVPIKSNAEPFFFAALGDTQDITENGLSQLEGLIDRINQRSPAFVVHIGEYKGGKDPCPDAYYERALQTSNRFMSPLIYLPGDNDWTDCFDSGYDPLERLDLLRATFYSDTLSLGKNKMDLMRQSSLSGFEGFPENVYWSAEGVAFATFHNVGTNNNLYSNESAAAEHFKRNSANLAWLDSTFDLAADAKALVIMTHANIKLDTRSWDPTGFDLFKESLSEHVEKFARPVLLIHGDTHDYKIDKPLQRYNQTVSNFTRLEVFGSPDLGVTYVHVYPDSKSVFRFESIAFD